MGPTGSSRVSSMVSILMRRMSSMSMALRRELFPELRVPAMSTVLAPSMMKLRRPAVRELMVFVLMKRGSVQGLSLCRLNEYA